MSFLTALRAPALQAQGSRVCTVRRAMEPMDSEQVEVLWAAIMGEQMENGGSWSPAALARTLADEGVPIGGAAIRRHREGLCSGCKAAGR